MADTAVAPNTGGSSAMQYLTQKINDYQNANQPQAPAVDTSKWAYDPQYEATNNSVMKQQAGLASGEGLQAQRLDEDTNKAVGLAGKQNESNLSALANKLANSGLSFSGVNVAEQGKLGDAYQTQINDLAQNKQRGVEDLVRDYVNKQAGYQDQLSQAQVDRAGRETDREKQQAADEAQAAAAKTSADEQRQWMQSLTQTLTQAVQPAPTPTGQLTTPAAQNPQAIIQKALAAVPPPAATTPQQQAQNAGIDPKALQTLLTQRGFPVGPIDGVMGIKTQQALARWKQSIGLPATADIDAGIYQQLTSAGIGNQGARGVATAGPAKAAL